MNTATPSTPVSAAHSSQNNQQRTPVLLVAVIALGTAIALALVLLGIEFTFIGLLKLPGAAFVGLGLLCTAIWLFYGRKLARLRLAAEQNGKYQRLSEQTAP